MPLFFIVGGFFLQPVSLIGFEKYFRKRIFPQLKIYFLSGIALVFAYAFIHKKPLAFTLDHLFRVLIGGRTLNLYTSTFWFIEVYLITSVVVTLIISVIKSKLFQLTIGIVGLYLSTWYTIVGVSIEGFKTLPWDLDITLMTIFYMLCGYLGFQFIQRSVKNGWLEVGMIGLAVGVLAGHYFNLFNFRLSMKSHEIISSLPKVILLLTIPLLFSFVVFIAASWTAKIPLGNFFGIIGRHTLIIMYAHKFILDICKISGLNWMPQLVLAVMVPVLISMMYQYLRDYLPVTWTT